MLCGLDLLFSYSFTLIFVFPFYETNIFMVLNRENDDANILVVYIEMPFKNKKFSLILPSCSKHLSNNRRTEVS